MGFWDQIHTTYCSLFLSRIIHKNPNKGVKILRNIHVVFFIRNSPNKSQAESFLNFWEIWGSKFLKRDKKFLKLLCFYIPLLFKLKKWDYLYTFINIHIVQQLLINKKCRIHWLVLLFFVLKGANRITLVKMFGKFVFKSFPEQFFVLRL